MECGTLSVLDGDVLQHILARLPFVDIFRMRGVCKEFHKVIGTERFQRSCALSNRSQGSYSPVFFFIDNSHGSCEWMGFDSVKERWARLPSLENLLPSPSPTLRLKNFFITSTKGLLCVNVSQDGEDEQIIIFNPLTQAKRELPPMQFRRQPVLLHLLVTDTGNAYKVIAAGSANMSTGNVSRKTEVYDSTTNEWESATDIPGPDFGLNEYQSGAYNNGILYCLAFSDDKQTAIVAYDVEKREWLVDWKCSLPREFERSFHPGRATNPQLLQCGEHIYFFWEESADYRATRKSQLRIAKLNPSVEEQKFRWSMVFAQMRNRDRGLLTFPEYTCSTSYGPDNSNGRLYISNTLSHSAQVYEIEAENGNFTPTRCKLPPAVQHNYVPLYPLNPATFSFEPNFFVGA